MVCFYGLSFLLLIANVFAGVSFTSDGSILLRPSVAGAPVNIMGNLLVNGTVLDSLISQLEGHFKIANKLNLFYLSSLRYQRIGFNAPQEPLSFVANGELFLGVPNAGTSSPFFKWNVASSVFQPFVFPSPSSTNRAFGHFIIGNTHYVVDSPSDVTPRVYQLSTSSFSLTPALSLGSLNGVDWEDFKIGNSQYMAQATQSGFLNVIYRYNQQSAQFSDFYYAEGLESVSDWEYIPIGTSSYLGAALDAANNVTIHSYSSGSDSWAPSSYFSAQKPTDLETFSSNSNFYLLVAESDSPTSQIRKWTGASFAFLKGFTVQNAQDFHLFNFQGDLFVASTSSSSTLSLFRWNPITENLNLLTSITSPLASRSLFIESATDQNSYLFVNSRPNSLLYKLNL